MLSENDLSFIEELRMLVENQVLSPNFDLWESQSGYAYGYASACVCFSILNSRYTLDLDILENKVVVSIYFEDDEYSLNPLDTELLPEEFLKFILFNLDRVDIARN